MKTFLMLILLASLTACGGGDPEDDGMKTIQPITCSKCTT